MSLYFIEKAFFLVIFTVSSDRATKSRNLIESGIIN